MRVKITLMSVIITLIRVEITLVCWKSHSVYIEIAFVHVVITLVRVEITLCLYKSHSEVCSKKNYLFRNVYAFCCNKKLNRIFLRMLRLGRIPLGGFKPEDKIFI
jgi:hypothetical protein